MKIFSESCFFMERIKTQGSKQGCQTIVPMCDPSGDEGIDALLSPLLGGSILAASSSTFSHVFLNVYCSFRCIDCLFLRSEISPLC